MRNIVVGVCLFINLCSVHATQELIYSSYLGGDGSEFGRDIAYDKNGNIYVVGGTHSANYIMTPGTYGYNKGHQGSMDVFVMKFDSIGNLIWSTLIGGPNYDRAYAVEIGDDGYIYLAGRAGDSFPTTANTFQPVFGGDANPINYGPQNGFVLKMTPNGDSIIWASYSGNDKWNIVRDMCVDEEGNVYLGSIAEVNYPHIYNGLDTILNGREGLLVKVKHDGTEVEWATYLGGTDDEEGGPAVRVDKTGVYYLCMTRSTDAPVTLGVVQPIHGSAPTYADFLLAKVSLDGKQLIYMTYFGGDKNDGGGTHNLAIDEKGNAYICGNTGSGNLPVTNRVIQSVNAGGVTLPTHPPTDAFVAKISPDASQILACSYLGGSKNEDVEGCYVDKQGNVYLTGTTASSNMKINSYGPLYAVNSFVNTDLEDGFVVKLNKDFSDILFCSYFGGNKQDMLRAVALGPRGNIAVTGMIFSNNMYVTLNALYSSHQSYGASGTAGCDNMLAIFNTCSNYPNVSIPDIGDTFYLNQYPVLIRVNPMNGILSGPGIVGDTLFPYLAGVGGIYDATYFYEDREGCGSSANIEYSVLPPLKAGFTVSDTIVEVYQSLNFADTTSWSTSRLWDFGDGATGSTLIQVDHTFDTVGLFNVKLIVSNNICSDTALKTIMAVHYSGYQYANATDLKIYPNPVEESFVVESTQNNYVVPIIQLFDLQGKLMYRSILKSNKESYDITHLPAGDYVLSIVEGNKNIFDKIIIKQ